MKEKSQITPQVLKDYDAARYIGMSPAFLRQSRMHGDRASRTPGPPYVRVGRAILYRLIDLDRWLESNLNKRGV
jgi:hypothetical protein